MEQALKQYFKIDAFRPQQKEAIETIMSGRDCLVLMPTGGGKSLCFQLPAVLLKGLVIVVSPLLALIQDQINELQAKGINAVSITSQLKEKERADIYTRLDNQENDEHPFQLLYVTPELLSTAIFQDQLRRLDAKKQLGLLAIDEAHCISSWGHDFRPKYRRIGEVRQLFPNMPCIALTATATAQVRQDIRSQLNFDDAHIYMQSFNRENVFYSIRNKDAIEEPEENLLECLESLKKKTSDGNSAFCGIIYIHTIKQVERIADLLKENGFSAAPYHSKCKVNDRKQVLLDWQSGKVQIVCATIAFGMGIDKASVRFVIHWNMPKSLEGFYQESGRAGRDGLPSESIMYFSYGDKSLLEFLNSKKYEKNPEAVQHNLKLLKYVEAYATSQSCRRRSLLRYFGQRITAENCNKTCDFCLKPQPSASARRPRRTGLSSVFTRSTIEAAKAKRATTKALRGENLASYRSQEAEYTTEVTLENGFVAVGGSSSMFEPVGSQRKSRRQLKSTLDDLEALEAAHNASQSKMKSKKRWRS